MTNQSDSLIRIQVLNRQRRFRICRTAVSIFCSEVLCAMYQVAPGLSVAFVSAREMRSINTRYRKRDYATDVLSFSYPGVSMEGQPFLGEIVIAPEVAARQADRYGARPERELRKLLVHGILHLLGYNHETDKGRMNRLQTRLLRRKRLANTPSLLDGKGRT